jgi:hypothetical protein
MRRLIDMLALAWWGTGRENSLTVSLGVWWNQIRLLEQSFLRRQRWILKVEEIDDWRRGVTSEDWELALYCRLRDNLGPKSAECSRA